MARFLLALIMMAVVTPADAQCAFPKSDISVESVKLTKEFKYLEPGVLFPLTSFQDSKGRPKSRSHARYIAVPNLVFPFDMDPREAPEDADDDQRSIGMEGGAKEKRDEMPAIMQSIVGSFGGCGAPGGGGNLDKRNYLYPDRDNFGETRDSVNFFVSSGRGHQGCDIRNPTGRKDADLVRAAETGTVVQISRSGHIAIQTRPKSQGGSGTMQFYLHIEKTLVARGQEVVAGQPIGLAGTIIRGKPNGTPPHLHFEIRVSSFVIDGETKTRNINLATGTWGIALPCYPSLVAAKMRELQLEPKIIGDQLVQDPRYEVTMRQFMTGDYGTSDASVGDEPETDLVQAPPTSKGYDSYWIIDNADRDDAVLGLATNVDTKGTDEFHLLTKRSTMFRSSPDDEMVFSGKVEPGDVEKRLPARYVGKLTLLDPSDDPEKRCPDAVVDAAGFVLDRPHRVELTAEVPLREPFPSCKATGDKRTDVYSIVFYGNSRPSSSPEPQEAPVIVDRDRKSIVEVTRNWGAITMPKVARSEWLLQAVDPDPADASKRKPRDPGYPWVYAGAWPGLKPIGERLDKFGQAVPAFETDEAGVSLWWFWIARRKGFGVDGNPSFRELARGIAGTKASDATVANYINNYVPLARKYFKNRVIDADSRMSLADPDERFALAWTMFHHEAGRTPLIDRTVFERGIKLGNDLLARSYKRLCSYNAKPCREDADFVPEAPKPGSDTTDSTAPDVAETTFPDGAGATSPGTVEDLRGKVSRLEDDVETLKEENEDLRATIGKAEAALSELRNANSALSVENDRLRRNVLLKPAKVTQKKVRVSASQRARKQVTTRIRSRYCSGSEGWLLCGGD